MMATAATQPNTTERLTIEMPSSVMTQITGEASRLGLQPASYLLFLHECHQGKIDRSFQAAIREVFTNDREILRKLAE
jgi:hypothetical protein